MTALFVSGSVASELIANWTAGKMVAIGGVIPGVDFLHTCTLMLMDSIRQRLRRAGARYKLTAAWVGDPVVRGSASDMAPLVTG